MTDALRSLEATFRRRHQGGLLEPGLDDGRDGVRGNVDLVERRRAGLRPLLRPDDPGHPHIKSFDGDRRGYVRCNVDRRRWRTDLRMVTTVGTSDAPAYTFASFEAEDGRPGAVKV